MKFKKLLSVFLAVVFIFSAFSTVNAFASEDRIVVASGICGAEGDNLKWTLYDDGELVISGEGEMDWYYPYTSSNTKYPPWYEKKDEIRIVTIEEGVTSVSTYACYGLRGLHRINLPVSLEFYEGNFIGASKIAMPQGARLAICYPGNGEVWDKVVRKTVDWPKDKETGVITREITGTEAAEVSSDKPVFNNIFDDAKLYLNGEEPQIFCEVIGDENLKTIRFDSVFHLHAKYYFAGRGDLKIQWNFEGISGRFSYEENRVGIKTTATLSRVDSGAGVAKISVVSENGKVLATDTSETLKPSESELERDELTPLEKFFVPFVAVFSELFFAFGFGINILFALIAMPFYELGALLGIAG